MKNTIFFLFFMTQLTILTGQTVSVGCQGGGTDCFSATLCTTPNGYTALINDDTFTVSKGYTRLIKWTPSGAYNSANPSGDNLNYYVEWATQPNSPVDKVMVEVTYSKGSQTVKRSDEKTVTVKYISAITQLNSNGSPISQGSSIACGVQSLTLSVSALTTNPSSGITYTWSLPSGWSGSSTTNTINVTTSAGTGGNIVVSARRNDVSCSQRI